MVKNYSSISLGYLIKTVVLINLELSFVKPWPQTLSPKTQKSKTKGPWADTKML